MLNNLSSVFRKKSSVFLLVLALIVCGMSAQAAGILNTKSGGYLLCVNSKTKVVTHPGISSCPSGSRELVLGAQGVAGANGLTGATGPVGERGPAGVSAKTEISELSLCDGSDSNTISDEKCKIGMTGPGGGIIFLVDYNDQYVGFNYLEAAPSSCESSKSWSSTGTSVPAVNGWARRAVGAGSINTAAIIAAFPADTSMNNAAHFAISCSAGSKRDWFLPSLGELKMINDNLQGLGGFVEDTYWSSSGRFASYAWVQYFGDGFQGSPGVRGTYYVRPVRAF